MAGGYIKARRNKPMIDQDRLNSYTAFNSSGTVDIAKYDVLALDSVIEDKILEVSPVRADGSDRFETSLMWVAAFDCGRTVSTLDKQSVDMVTQANVPFDTSAASLYDPVYLSGATAGKVTLSPPGFNERQVGFVIRVGAYNADGTEGLILLAPERLKNATGAVDLWLRSAGVDSLVWSNSDRVNVWGQHFDWQDDGSGTTPPVQYLAPKYQPYRDLYYEGIWKFGYSNLYVDAASGDDDIYEHDFGYSRAADPYATIQRAVMDLPRSRSVEDTILTINVAGAGTTLDYDESTIYGANNVVIEFTPDWSTPAKTYVVTTHATFSSTSAMHYLTVPDAAVGNDLYNGYALKFGSDVGWVYRSTDNGDGTHTLLIQPPKGQTLSGDLTGDTVEIHDPAVAFPTLDGEVKFVNCHNLEIRYLYGRDFSDARVIFENCTGTLTSCQFDGKRTDFVNCQDLTLSNVLFKSTDPSTQSGSQAVFENCRVAAELVGFDGEDVTVPPITSIGTTESVRFLDCSKVTLGQVDFVQCPPVRIIRSHFIESLFTGFGNGWPEVRFWDNTPTNNSVVNRALIYCDDNINYNSRVFDAGSFPPTFIGLQPTWTQTYLIKAPGHRIAFPLQGEATIDLTTAPPTYGPLTHVATIGAPSGTVTPFDMSGVAEQHGGGAVYTYGDLHAENNDERVLPLVSADDQTRVIDWTLGTSVRIPVDIDVGDNLNLNIQMVAPRAYTPCYLHLDNAGGAQPIGITWTPTSAEYTVIWQTGTPPGANANSQYIIEFVYIPRAAGGTSGTSSGRFIGRIYAGPY